MKIQRGTKSDRSAGISFSSNVSPNLPSFQKGLEAKIVDSERLAVNPLHNRVSIKWWPNKLNLVHRNIPYILHFSSQGVWIL